MLRQYAILFTVLAAVAPCPRLALGDPPNPPAIGFRELVSVAFLNDYLKEVDRVHKQILALAAAMPQETYAWRPAEGVRSVSEVYLHIAFANYMLLGVGGYAPPADLADHLYITGTQAWDTATTDKAAISETLSRSFQHLRSTVAGIRDADLEIRIGFFGQEVTKRQILLLALGHLHEHLGQSIAYARMNSVVPPWTAAQQEAQREATMVSRPNPASERKAVEPIYRSAMRARDQKQWNLAAVLFDLALQERATEGGNQVLLYGTRWADYTPHLHLGEALFELGLYPQAFAEWQASLKQSDWRSRDRRAIHERYIPEFESFCLRRIEIVQTRINESRSALPRIQARVREARPPDAPPGTAADPSASVTAAESLVKEALEILPAAGAARLCRIPAEAVDEAAKVSEALKRARRLKQAEGLSERAHAELFSVERRLDAWRASAERDRAARALAEIERRLEALETSPKPLRRNSSLGRTQVRTASLSPADYGEASYEAAGAFEVYLIGLGYATAGRCREAVEHLEHAVAKLGDGFEAPAHWGLDCGTESASWQDKRCYRPHAALAFAHAICTNAGATVRARRELETAIAARELTEEWEEKIEQLLARRLTIAPYRRSSALLIGVSTYQHERAWPPLMKVKDDLEALAAALRERDVVVAAPLLNASKMKIEDAIEAAIRASAGESAQRFVFYFGGHGDTYRNRLGVTLGYIVPFDAPETPEDPAGIHDFLTNQVVRLDQFFDWSRRLDAGHALFIFDSCFSGSIKSFADEDRLDHAFDPEEANKPARIFLAAGREDQQVSASSEFREALVRSISGCADADRNGYVAASELGDYLSEIFRNNESQTPWWGELDDPLLSGGEVLFEVRGTPTDCPDARSQLDTTDVALWEKVNELYAAIRDPRVLEAYEESPAAYFRPALEFKRQILLGGPPHGGERPRAPLNSPSSG